MQLRLIFKVPSMTRWEVLRSLTRQKAIFFLKEFQGLCGLCRKDNSSQSSGGCLRLFSRDCVGARGKSVPLSGWGIRTSFPHNDLEDGADLNMVCSIGKNSKRDPWRRGIVSHEIPPEEVTRLRQLQSHINECNSEEWSNSTCPNWRKDLLRGRLMWSWRVGAGALGLWT